jgi:hypothetical protein
MVHGSLAALAAAVARAAPRLRRAPIALSDAAAERIRALLGQRSKVRRPLLPGSVGRGRALVSSLGVGAA